MNRTLGLAIFAIVVLPGFSRAEETMPLSIAWADKFLTIRGPKVPGEAVRVHYLEAYCRPGSTDRDWKQTIIPHKTEVLNVSPENDYIQLRDTLEDGVTVTHDVRALDGEVTFDLLAHNPKDTASDVAWAQPCIRLDKFTGHNKTDYLPWCFIFVDHQLTTLPTTPWATEARYVPGQVYVPAGVNRNDVNPRPQSTIVPSNGLCGVFSDDRQYVLATAWEPYQELFQGVIACMHSDFRIGGLEPGENKNIRGKIYIAPAVIPDLMERYIRDFPEQAAGTDSTTN
jgi:hypothetical protein